MHWWTTPYSKGKKGLDQPESSYLKLHLHHSIACLSLRGSLDAPGSRDNLSTPSLTMQMAGGGVRVSRHMYQFAAELLLRSIPWRLSRAQIPAGGNK
jgi:hypothetical protein